MDKADKSLPALSIENLVKKYNGFEAVKGISFSISQGEFFGFLGPNGAGKTTTINCATGIARITSGSIRVFGNDVVRDYRQARRHIGISPQEFNADAFISARNMLWYIAGYYGVPLNVRRARVEDVLERFDLLSHADKQFRMLSGGLKRRVVLARAMVHDPDLLILDEPTAGVDVELRHHLWRYFRELNKAGKTILLTSHYLEEVEMLCERIAIINHGKIVAIGDKKDFISDGKRLEESYLEITRKDNSDK